MQFVSKMNNFEVTFRTLKKWNVIASMSKSIASVTGLQLPQLFNLIVPNEVMKIPNKKNGDHMADKLQRNITCLANSEEVRNLYIFKN